MDAESMKNLQLDKICRCCLTVKREMRPLFGELIAEMVTECFGIKVERMDGWPDKICMQCVHQVCRFHSFKLQVEKCDQQLREYIKGITVVVVEKQVPQEVAIGKLGISAGQPFIARTPNGQSVQINGAPLLTTAATGFNPGSVQLIPVQMLSTNSGPQVVQLRPNQIQSLAGSSAATINQLEPYFEDAIGPHSASLESIEIFDDSENVEGEEEEEAEAEEGEEVAEEEEYEVEVVEFPQFVMKEVEESDYEMQREKQPGSQGEEDENLAVYNEDAGEVWDPGTQQAEEQQSQDEEESLVPLPSSRLATKEVSGAATTEPEDDPEVMASLISLQTSCPEPGRHVCNLCHREFRFSKWLHSHMKSHTNWFKANCKKPPQCKICDKTFKGPGMLRMHMKTHEERSLKCSLCLKPYQNEHRLNLHMERHRTRSENVKCELCERKFISLNDFRIHRRTLGKTCVKHKLTDADKE